MNSGKLAVLAVLLLVAGVQCDHERRIPDLLDPRIAIDPIWSPTDDRDAERTGPVSKDDGEDELPELVIDPIWDPETERLSNRLGICSIGTNNGDLPMTQPILVSPVSRQLLQPSKDSFVRVNPGEIIDMYCTGSFVGPLTGKKISATCVEDSVFMVDGEIYNFRDFQCSSLAGNLVRRTSRTCYETGVIVEIGFDLVDNFIHLMDICHDPVKQTTHWVHYDMGPYLGGYQSGISRPLFIAGGFFGGVDVNQLYTQVQQKRTVDHILGYDSQRYFNIAQDIYMARGHMAAKVDFVYAPAQWATFYFLNAAPQWQTFNGGNWERIEFGVRKFAADRDLDLDVYTGNWGVMSLPDVNGEPKQLYLNFDENDNGLIPVPKVYWRVVIDTASKLGIAFVGVNNVHATQEEIDEEYILCTDISDSIDWIPWDKKNILRGYSYACEVDDLAQTIGTLPALEVSGLLL